MFNTRPQAPWNPYTIPPTPTIPSGSPDVYSLSCEEGANGTKNPSQFLKWKKMKKGGLPDGAIAKQFDICENGEPTQYWFVVWQEEPDLEVEEE